MSIRRRVLITRPETAARETATAVERLGFEAVLFPLLRIERLETEPPEGAFDRVILTSANAATPGLRTWLQSRAEPPPAIVTGTATEEAARDLGFVEIQSVDGGALDVVDALRGAKGRCLYPCAEQTAHDLPALLAAIGLLCDRWPVYRSVEAEAFPADIRTGLEAGDINTVLLYSPRTAAVFARLVGRLPESVSLFCLSEAVATAVGEKGKGRCIFPSRPNEKALLALLTEPESGQRL